MKSKLRSVLEVLSWVADDPARAWRALEDASSPVASLRAAETWVLTSRRKAAEDARLRERHDFN